MDFVDEVRGFVDKIQTVLPHIKTEEATKHSLILPFLQILGYNVFDPAEVVPEFTADVGTKKGEKVDYAIMINNQPAILIEAKSVLEPLEGHEAQLFRYFSATSAKFAILTNGLVYKFFSDLQEANKMDQHPFLEFSLPDCKESVVAEVKKFHKENFNVDDLSSTAANLKYSTKIRAILEAEFKEPTEDFLRFLLKDVHEGKITQNVLERFRPLVKRTVGQYFSEMISDKLKTAIQTTMESERQVAAAVQDIAADHNHEGESPKSKIVTTAEELEGFYIIKAILWEQIDPNRITYKDTASYFGVLLDQNVRKWVCRLYLNGSKKSVAFHGVDKAETWVEIDHVGDLFLHRQELIQTTIRIAGTTIK